MSRWAFRQLLAIAGGGNGGGAPFHRKNGLHPEDSWVGPQTALLLTLALAGIDGVTEPLLPERDEHASPSD